MVFREGSIVEGMEEEKTSCWAKSFYHKRKEGGRTLSYGHMTSSHNPSHTPLHSGSVWDPSSAATLARSTDEFELYRES